jgi:hypothetical protein
MRPVFLVMVVTVLCSNFASALEWDIAVPGAKARLGFGGGFFVGAWSQLRLEVSGAGAYSLKLDTLSGRFREGFQSLTAKLEVEPGSGVRVRTLELPLSNHVVHLRLESEAGAKIVTIQPLNAATAISLTTELTGVRGNSFELSPLDLPTNPALLLGVPQIVASETASPGALLAALAAGVQVSLNPADSSLNNLSGTVGLGRLERDPNDPRLPPTFSLDGLAKAIAPEVEAPTGRHLILGWWSVGGALLSLWIYSARRFELRFVRGSALAMLGFGLVGFWAFAPNDSVFEKTSQLLIGAQGWGLNLKVHSRLDLRSDSILLPAGAKVFGGEILEYLVNGVKLQTKAWRRHSYLLPPVAGVVPLRVVGGRIENTGAIKFSEVQVIGYGAQEPLAPGASLRYQETGITSFGNFETLPRGSVVARASGLTPLIVIALPEEKTP